MTDLELICTYFAFLVGFFAGWEVGGYRISKRAYSFFRSRFGE